MHKITFILGGARSGKSRLALEMARAQGGKTAFIATCEPLDKEMSQRISRHKKSRPVGWKTFDCPVAIAPLLYKARNKFAVIIIDCLTLWVSNLLLKNHPQEKIEARIKLILSALRKTNARCIIVSNEVGLGIVPDSKLGRDFRDIAGRVNQIVAAEADEVFFMAAGIPLKVK